MQASICCPTCKKTGPILRRLPLHRNQQGRLVDGGIHAWGVVLGCGLFLALLTMGELLVNGLMNMVPPVLVWGPAVLGGSLILAASIGWIVIGRTPVAAYAYTCKGCGQQWQTEATA